MADFSGVHMGWLAKSGMFLFAIVKSLSICLDWIGCLSVIKV